MFFKMSRLLKSPCVSSVDLDISLIAPLDRYMLYATGREEGLREGKAG